MATGTDLRPLLRPWLSSVAQNSQATARSYAGCVVRFLDTVGDRELSPETLVEYTESLADAGLTRSSQGTNISAARSFLRACQEAGLIERSPVEWLRRPKVEISPYGKWLTLEELRAMAEAARELGPIHDATVWLLWTTGLRVSEASGACWSHVYADPEGRIGLRVLHAKGGRERQVRLLPDVLARLAAIRSGPHAGSEQLDPNDDTPLLPYRAWWIWRAVKDTAARAGVSKNVSPHTYRHSFATWCAAGDATMVELMQSCGWKRAETAMVYIGLAKGLAKTAVDRLPAL